MPKCSIEWSKGSVTRFSKMWPLWQTFEGLFITRQNLEPALANLYRLEKYSVAVNGQTNISSHLVTLSTGLNQILLHFLHCILH